MHVVIRQYTGSAKLIDELVERRRDVEELIRGVEGFLAYYLVRSADGGASISVFESQDGTRASSERAAAYIAENLAGVAAGPPQVVDGEAVIHFT